MAIEIDPHPIVRGLFKSDIRPGERELRWFTPCDRLSPFVQRFWFASGLFRTGWPIYHKDGPQALAIEIESYLIGLQPRHDSLSLKASEIAQIAEDNLDISSVASLANRLGLSQRSVQEICHRGLGVHPKWLIGCFRLPDAALRLEAEANLSLSGLVQALGYFDQAHFTRDFRRATGVNPGQYRLSVRAGAKAST